MAGDMHAAADIATGEPVAHATDPAIAPATHRAAPGALCLNCATRLIGDHCHACGQAAHVHRSLGAVAHEIGHGVFHFEGRIWRTLPMLVIRPGALTRRYIAGERARFVSPLALFLFCVFLMFGAISALGPGDFGQGMAQGVSGAERAVAQGESRVRAQLAALARERDHAIAAGRPTAAIDRRIAAERRELQALNDTRTRFTPGGGDSLDIRDGSGWLSGIVARVRENPGLVAYKLQSSAYKFSWALIPLSTPFVALMFLWRRRHGMYDHAIFVTYSLCFMTLLVVALTLAAAAGMPSGLVVPAAIVAPPLHMYKQLRGAYLLRRRSALWRTALLVAFSFTVLVLFSLGLVALGVSR
jgi:hypothetical protein